MSGVRGSRGRFAAGNPGGGRPKGSRNRLSEEFIQALCDDFAKHGVAVIEQVRVESPADYLKTIAKLVPKEIDLEVSGGPFASWSDEELDMLLQQTRQQIQARGGETNGGLH